jgi:uncharacterized membrane protein
MNRQAFLSRLREGLKGLSASARDEIMADYEAHFTEGEAAGRSDTEIAQALGDPNRLARELRAEAGLRRWEERRDPSAAAGAIFAVLGLATVDLLILAPILIAVGATLFGLFVAAGGVFIAGAAVFGFGLAGAVPGVVGPLQAAFAGLGLMSGAVAGAAILTLIVVGLVNLLVQYGRLHYRLLKPAVES